MTTLAVLSASTKRSSPRERVVAESDRGNATIETVILFPIVIIMIMAIVQGALLWHGHNVAQSVANGALQAARIDGGDDSAGQAEASARLERGGGSSLITDPNVSISRTPTTVTVIVSGDIPSLIPGFDGLRVSQTASGAVERFTTEDAR